MGYFTCFGEVLWDVFPNEAKIGGAPLNVAFRLKTFENNVAIISAVGKDVLGEKLIQYLDDNLINTEFIQNRAVNALKILRKDQDGNFLNNYSSANTSIDDGDIGGTAGNPITLSDQITASAFNGSPTDAR